jgi:hypothetical protein
LWIEGEDNYAPDGRVVILPIMGLVLLYCYGESMTKEIRRMYLHTKKRFAFAIKLFLHGMCPDGFILSMKKGGGEKVDEEDDEIRKK